MSVSIACAFWLPRSLKTVRIRPPDPHDNNTLRSLPTPTHHDNSRYDTSGGPIDSNCSLFHSKSLNPPTPTHHDNSRYDTSGGPIASNCSLFHSKSLNCNLWYLLDLLSNKNFEIAPFPLSLRLHQQDPISHTRRDHISRPTATSSWSRRFL